MILIRQALQDDIAQLIKLNKIWQYNENNEAQKETGFLVNALFNRSEFAKIIDSEEMVIAEVGNEIIGYYLVDNYSITENLKTNKELIDQLKGSGLIDKTLRIASRAQAVVDTQYQNQGVSKKMFEVLKLSLKEKFDVVFSSVGRSNPKIIVHQKVGYKTVYEDNDSIYVLYKF